ncbi:hypothetical protein CRE_07722 [Caenorhabditis remanei]|uniref:Arrestin C-terminal-like domain-containing protein n=1 Tax=Caenorhabditis remanei TaxID=31234 RepID=E3MZT9_CAERE|nr:hypothetical protein CRE_07722 [Caenorhabditis remanei]
MDHTYTIEFDQPNAIYVPGQLVRGTLTIYNTCALNALSLKICIHGEVETFWKKFASKDRVKKAYPNDNTHGGPKSHCYYYKYSDHTRYTSKLNVLTAVSQPWSSIQNPTNKIPIGANIFPFVFQLPVNCPPSFEGTHGSVRYHVHVELNRPWSLDVEAKRSFTVIPIIDLNMIPKVLNPMISNACRHSGFLSSKEVKIKFSIPKSGYTPGEVIPISIFIHNHAKKPIYYAKAKLMQHVHYQAQQENTHMLPDEHCHKHCEHKTAESVISEMEKSFEIKCCSEGEVQLALVLPNPLMPTFQTAILEVDYCIIVEVEEDKKLRCEFPVTIGTVPIGRVMGLARAPTYSIVEGDIPLLVEAPPEYQERVEVVMASAPPPE